MNNTIIDQIKSNPELFTFETLPQAQEWLTTLPQGNSDESSKKLLIFFKQFNQQNTEIIFHYQLLNLLAPTINNVLDTLKTPYHFDAFPLSANSQIAFNIKQDLLRQVCISYKQLINQLNPLLSSHEKAVKLLCVAIYHALHYSSLLLLEKYLTYTKPEKNFWKEIHQVFQLAKKHDQHQVSLIAINDSDKKTHISSCYKRILILACMDPFHLMQTEIEKTFIHLEHWSWYAKFVEAEAFAAKGGLLINPSLDIPATRVDRNTSGLDSSTDLLYLDISDITKVTRIQIQKLILSLETDDFLPNHTTFTERAALSMYSRLNKVLIQAYKRSEERIFSNDMLCSAIGLTTSHRLFSNDIEFTPEEDEIELKKGTLGGSLHLTLVPKEHTPWIEKSLEEDIKTGVVKPRESHFEEDIWKKKQSSELPVQVENDQLRKEILVYDTRIENLSEMGFGAYIKKETGIHAHIGELISFKKNTDISQDWNIGIIKWLICQESNDLKLGVYQLQGSIKPIAVKAISGVGEGSEYFRALIIENETNQPDRTLITPNAVYDLNTILLVNLKDKLRYIRLTKLLASSSHYSQFAFESTSNPDLNRADNSWV